MYGYLTLASSVDFSDASLLWLVNNAALNVSMQNLFETSLSVHLGV